MVQDNNIDLAAAIAFYNTEIVVARDIAFCNNILLFTQDEFFFFFYGLSSFYLNIILEWPKQVWNKHVR